MSRAFFARAMAPALLCSGLLLGCTQPAPWSSEEGMPGQPCFPDETCDPGLTCLSGICYAGGGPWDLGLTDRALRDRSKTDKGRPTDVRPEKPVTCTSAPAAPSVTSYPKSTSFTKVAVKGTAPGAATLQVSGGAAPQSTPVVGGVFCLEVQLAAGTVNTLKLVAVDAKGCASSPVLIDILQKPASSQNLVLGMTAKTINQPDQGQVSALTDGQLSTTVRYSFWDPLPGCDTFEHLWFDLGASKTVDQVMVHYAKKSGFKYYATCWGLLISTQAAPSDPDPTHPDWKVVQSATTGTDADLTLQVAAQARHVALLLYEDGATSLYSTFEVSELEVYGPGDPPTCP
jgi:hypothetical protein